MSAIDIMGLGCLAAGTLLILWGDYMLRRLRRVSGLVDVDEPYDGHWVFIQQVGRVMLGGVAIWIVATVVSGDADMTVSIMGSVGLALVLIFVWLAAET